MTTPLPSAALDADAWAKAGDELVETLRDLIRIPSVNPPPVHAPDGELQAARWIAQALGDAGVPAEIHEPVPGRGSVTARLRGDGTGGEPLLLLSHLDVVPAPPDDWTHDPFAADIADGQIWGRGAVDMKHLVAMELDGRCGCSPRRRGRPVAIPAERPDPGPDARHPVRLDRRRGGGRPQRHRCRSSSSARSCSGPPARSTSPGRSRRRSAARGSTRSASPRRATRSTASPSTGRGATARCRARTTPRCWPRGS